MKKPTRSVISETKIDARVLFESLKALNSKEKVPFRFGQFSRRTSEFWTGAYE